MTNIYVGNLDFATHEDQLQTLFAAYGAVKTVTAVKDRDTGQPRGFAFVEMTNGGKARDAIRTLNGSVHGGRALIVNEARPKLYRSGEHESLPVGITGAIVSKVGRRCCWLFLRKVRENSTHFQTRLPSETGGNYEYRQL